MPRLDLLALLSRFLLFSRAKDAEECKNKGNESYKATDYRKALDYYTQAIGRLTLLDRQSAFFLTHA